MLQKLACRVQAIGAIDIQAHFNQRDLQQFTQVSFIVDDQDTGCCHE
ncbi:hypothetical protein [Noviherbaspirillum sp. Root189]|nr:hypothetical protein [Noviherbaspirillum sp. Root189]